MLGNPNAAPKTSSTDARCSLQSPLPPVNSVNSSGSSEGRGKEQLAGNQSSSALVLKDLRLAGSDVSVDLYLAETTQDSSYARRPEGPSEQTVRPESVLNKAPLAKSVTSLLPAAPNLPGQVHFKQESKP